MEKTVNDFIKELQALKPSLREKPIVVNAPNGEQFEATIKIGLENPHDWENVKCMVVTYK
jgi:hypothetical protein